jgi:hypothetical protein
MCSPLDEKERQYLPRRCKIHKNRQNYKRQAVTHGDTYHPVCARHGQLLSKIPNYSRECKSPSADGQVIEWSDPCSAGGLSVKKMSSGHF